MTNKCRLVRSVKKLQNRYDIKQDKVIHKEFQGINDRNQKKRRKIIFIISDLHIKQRMPKIQKPKNMNLVYIDKTKQSQ